MNNQIHKIALVPDELIKDKEENAVSEVEGSN